MRHDLKRSPSPLPLSDVKKLKQEYDWDQDEIPFSTVKRGRSPTYDPERMTFEDDPNHGTVFKSVPHLAQNSVLNAIIVQTTCELSAVGKRLIQAPRLLENGIVFEWVYDATVKGQPTETLLAISGVDRMALAAALQRTETAGRSGGDVAVMTIDLSCDEDSGVDDKSAAIRLGADAAHPIIIDTDDSDRAGHHRQEQSSEEKGNIAYHRSPGKPVQSVQDVPRQMPAPAEMVVHQSQAEPSQPRKPTPVSHGEVATCLRGEIKHGKAGLSRAKLPTGPAAKRSPPSNSRRLVPSTLSPSTDPYPPFKGFSSDSDGDSSSGEEDVKATSATRHAIHAPDPAEGVRTIDLYAELNRGNARRQVLMPAAVPVQSSAEGAQSSSGLRHRESPNPSGSRRPLRPPNRPKTRRATNQAVRNVQARDAEASCSSGSSEESEDSRRPAHARQRRAPAPQRSSAIVRSGLCGGNAQIQRHEVSIPKAEFSRARRLLASIDREIPYTTITMRGDASFIDKQRLCRISAFSLPFYQPDKAPAALVADACLVQDNKVVVGFMHGPCQASLISLGDQPHRIDLAHRAHNTVQENAQLGTSRPNSGISTLAPLDGPQLRFLSGGFDTTIHLWTLIHTGNGCTARSKRLDVRQLQGVQSLAYRSVDNTLLSCGGSSIYCADISAYQQPKPIKVADGRLLQVHVHPQNPQVVILEADQIENQVLVYDTRVRGFHHRPALQFGHRSNPNAENNTRFLKGSTLNSLFARPYNENDKGAVRLWDYRKATAIVACFKEEHSAPVVHAVLSGSDLLAYGGTSVTIWKTRTE